MSSQDRKRQKLTPDLVPESDEEAPKEHNSSEDGAEKSSKLSPKKNKDNEYYFDIGKNRRITIRKFKGNCYIDIREFYEDESGEKRPGKKGISLSTEQWDLVKNLSSSIDTELKNLKSK